MRHVKQIREIIAAGRNEEAHAELATLLELGPHNIEALKLRAQLFAYEGRFADEYKAWEQIAGIDREDPDAIGYFVRKQQEDREHFYYSDDLPGGGRRFATYPRAALNASAAGLLGCLTFLTLSQVTGHLGASAERPLMLLLFGVFVIVPVLAIVLAWTRGMKALTVTPQGVTITTRFRSFLLRWSDLARIALARGAGADGSSRLALVLIPKDQSVNPIEINLAPESSVIRARSHLVREIGRVFQEPEYVLRSQLNLEDAKIIRY